jgi:hypothetical protein
MVMMRSLLLGLLLTLAALDSAKAVADDWIFDVPLTPYFTTPIRLQNMDYDFDNNMFLAHSGWYNDRELHYYKFRMYTPEEYPELMMELLACRSSITTPLKATSTRILWRSTW